MCNYSWKYQLIIKVLPKNSEDLIKIRKFEKIQKIKQKIPKIDSFESKQFCLFFINVISFNLSEWYFRHHS